MPFDKETEAIYGHPIFLFIFVLTQLGDKPFVISFFLSFPSYLLSQELAFFVTISLFERI